MRLRDDTVDWSDRPALPLVEAGVVLLLSFGVLAGVVDLTPLVRALTHRSFGPPDFAVLDPLFPLLRGLMAVLVVTWVAVLLRRSLFASASTPAGDAPSRGLSIVAWLLITLALATPAARDMFDRTVIDEAPGNTERFRSRAHDGGVLQTELAMQALVEGENPYEVDYGDTAMARARDSDPAGWRALGYDRNPALGHLPYLPAAFLLPLPVAAASESLFGWYDQRVFYVLAALVFVALAGLLARPGGPRRLVWLVTGMSPLLLPFVRIGRNDVVILALLAAVAVALQRKSWVVAGVALGLAAATKQFAWVAAFFVTLWLVLDPAVDKRDARRTLVATLATVAVLVVPFVIWSPRAFVDDVLLFQLGLGDDAYPLRPDSLGLAALVVGLGWANDLRGGFPMWLFQVGLTVPLLVAAVWRLRAVPSLAGAWAWAAAVLLIGLFSSSFFALNYWAHPAYWLLFAALATPRLADWRSG